MTKPTLILIHGMGRTPMAMAWLYGRLRRAGRRAQLFGYLPALESLAAVTARLRRRIDALGGQPYILVGHSLGTVIIRQLLTQPDLHPPQRCVFLAPPMVACRAATYFCQFWWYRRLTGEMGQLLAQPGFMAALPLPRNLQIFAGTGGPTWRWLPWQGLPNDGVLLLSEAGGGSQLPVVALPVTHTFIMNTEAVFRDLNSR